MEYYLGQIVLGAFPITPRGMLPCDGRLLPVSSYQALFSLLSNRFGGDGVNTFALPDLRGRAALGAGPNNPLGRQDGQEKVTLTTDNFPPHTHTLAATNDSTAGTTAAGSIFCNSGSANAYAALPAEPSVQMQADAMASTGASQGHENRQPYLVMNWLIATTGVYPSRN